MPNDDPVADRFFHLVTHLGDSALLIPLTLAVTFVLWRGAHRGAAWRFGGAVAASVLLTLVAKLLFYADGGSEELDILSPSGHASFGIAVYGGLALLLARRRPPGVQALIGLGALALVLAIAASRIVLETHTPRRWRSARRWERPASPSRRSPGRRRGR